MKLLTTSYQFCIECDRTIVPVVEIGTDEKTGNPESGGTFCLDCLRAAVALLEAAQETAATAAAPQEEQQP